MLRVFELFSLAMLFLTDCQSNILNGAQAKAGHLAVLLQWTVAMFTK